MIVSGQAAVLLSLLMLQPARPDDGTNNADVVESDQEENSFLTLPTFFDFKKEIENIFPEATDQKHSDSQQSSSTTTGTSSDYILEAGVSLERDYDFYSDVEASESEAVPVTVRAGYRPG